MWVGIDESGRDDAVRRVDHDRGTRVRQGADRRDPVSAHADVCDEPGRSAAVHHRTPANEQVEVHGQANRPRASSGMTVSTTPSRKPMNASCRKVVVSW